MLRAIAASSAAKQAPPAARATTCRPHVGRSCGDAAAALRIAWLRLHDARADAAPRTLEEGARHASAAGTLSNAMAL